MKRIISLVLTLALLLFALPVGAQAAGIEYQVAAERLYRLGLISGTGTDASGRPIYELDRAPTRSEAITVLVKLLGKADEASKGGWDMPFTDVPDWARNFVGYAYQNGLTSGTSATTFGGDDPVTAAQYLTFMLKALGYSADEDFAWDKAWELSDRLGFTDGRYNAQTAAFTRGDVFLISAGALLTHVKGSDRALSAYLLEQGVYSVTQFKAAMTVGEEMFQGDRQQLAYEHLKGIIRNHATSADGNSLVVNEGAIFSFQIDQTQELIHASMLYQYEGIDYYSTILLSPDGDWFPTGIAVVLSGTTDAAFYGERVLDPTLLLWDQDRSLAFDEYEGEASVAEQTGGMLYAMLASIMAYVENIYTHVGGGQCTVADFGFTNFKFTP